MMEEVETLESPGKTVLDSSPLKEPMEFVCGDWLVSVSDHWFLLVIWSMENQDEAMKAGHHDGMLKQ